MRSDLQDTVVMITGAARGIGAETARQLAARGARLSLVGLEGDRLEALATELGAGHVWHLADVTNQSALDAAVAGTVATFGRLDVLVANAGIANNGTVAVNSAEAQVRTIDVNVNGVIRSITATLPHLVASRGHVLIISSAAALSSCPGLAAYSASKIAVEHYGAALRMEVAHKGVTVGVAHPCWVDTDLVRSTRADLAAYDAFLRRLPWPYDAVAPVEECAAALVEGIATRRRKIYIPKAMGVIAALRPFFMGPVWEWLMARHPALDIEALEREVTALGRAFCQDSAGFASDTPATGPSPKG